MAAAGTAANAEPASARPDPARSPAGRYVLSGARRGVLTLAQKDGVWKVSLAGGVADDGAATAADCQLEAEGPLKDGRIEARVVPFEAGNTAVSAADLAARPAGARITLDGEAAIVTTDFNGCGVGADLSGRYVRPAPGKIAEGDQISDLAVALPDARLKILEGYPWARFAIERGGRTLAVVGLDGENEDLVDGRNSQQAIGAEIGWSDLKPGLRVVRVEAGAS